MNSLKRKEIEIDSYGVAVCVRYYATYSPINHLIQAIVLRMRALRFDRLGNLPQFVQLVNKY